MDDRFDDRAIALRRVRGAVSAFAEAHLLAKEVARVEGEELPPVMAFVAGEAEADEDDE